jgi:ribose-phosphate pyrophosphokinase
VATSIEREGSKRLMVFAGRSSKALGEKIADRLGIELGAVDLKTFANGELYVRFGESVRGADIFLVQSTSMPVNDNLFELLLMINAAKLASAHRITAVMPWYGYSRQDKKSASTAC